MSRPAAKLSAPQAGNAPIAARAAEFKSAKHPTTREEHDCEPQIDPSSGDEPATPKQIEAWLVRNLADGDDVLAVVRGTAVNQDGRTSSVTVPSGAAQQDVIRCALADGGLSADQISYIEAHGTGTLVGDPVEAAALREAFGASDGTAPLCYFGSVKGNVGHLETASGLAGLIKVVLMLNHHEIYRQVNFQSLSPHVTLDGSRLAIPTESSTWQPIGGRRLAGVNSFGFGGTNAHVVLEQAPSGQKKVAAADLDRPRHLLTISAQSESALRELAGRYQAALAAESEGALADLPLPARAVLDVANGRAFHQRQRQQQNSASRRQSAVGPSSVVGH